MFDGQVSLKERIHDSLVEFMSSVLSTENYTSKQQEKLKVFAISGKHFSDEIKQNILVPLDIREDPPEKPSDSAHNFLHKTPISSNCLTDHVRQIINLLYTYLSTYKGKRTEPLLCAAIYKIVIKIYEAKYDSLSEIDKRESEIETLKTWFQNIRSNPVKFSENLKLLLIKIENTLNSMQSLLEKEKKEVENADLYNEFYNLAFKLPFKLQNVINSTAQYLTSLPNVCEAIYGKAAKKKSLSFSGFSATQLLEKMDPYSLEGRLLVSTNIGHSLLNILDININKDNAVLLSFLKIQNKDLIPLAESPHYISSPEGIGICSELWQNNSYNQTAIRETITLLRNLAITGTYLKDPRRAEFLYGEGKEFFILNINQTLHDLKIVEEHLESINVEAYSLTLNPDRKRNIAENYNYCADALALAIKNYNLLQEKHIDLVIQFSHWYLKASSKFNDLQENYSFPMDYANALVAIENAPINKLRQKSSTSTSNKNKVAENVTVNPQTNLPSPTVQANSSPTSAQSNSYTVLTPEQRNLSLNLGWFSATIQYYKTKAKKRQEFPEIKKLTSIESYNSKVLNEITMTLWMVFSVVSSATVAPFIGVYIFKFKKASPALQLFTACSAAVGMLGYFIFSYINIPDIDLKNKSRWEKLGYALSNIIISSNSYKTVATTKSALKVWNNEITGTLKSINFILSKSDASQRVANKQFVLTMLDAIISTDYSSFNKLVPNTDRQKELLKQGNILRNLFLEVTLNNTLIFKSLPTYITSKGIFTDEGTHGCCRATKYTLKSTERKALNAAIETLIQLIVDEKAELEGSKERPCLKITDFTTQQLRTMGLELTA